jgi:hypothetical protein
MKNLLLIAAALALLASAVWLLQAHDRRYLSSEESVRELMYFPTAQAVRVLAAGNQLVAADYLWLRMIQYYAFHRERDSDFRYLHPIIDRLTDLDPRFVYPYTFGALLLVHDAGDSVNSLALLDKAKRLNPEKWEFPYMKGFILYIFLRKWEESAREFLAASELPGAVPGAKRYAAYIYRRMGAREVSKAMWHDICQGTSNRLERDVAKVYLDRIEMEETIERLQIAAEKYHKMHGHWPANLWSLVEAGFVSAVPREDPFKGRYYWSADSSKVKSTSQNKFLK